MVFWYIGKKYVEIPNICADLAISESKYVLNFEYYLYREKDVLYT